MANTSGISLFAGIVGYAGISPGAGVTQKEGVAAYTSGGSSYTGPLDLVPGAVVAYSAARALSAAKRGSPAYTISKFVGVIASATIVNGGSEWQIGDTFSVNGGDGNATGVVDTGGENGPIVTFHLTSGGTGYTSGTNVQITATGGSIGTGASIATTVNDPAQEFSFDAVTGLVPVASILAYLDSAAGSVEIWNDQSANAIDVVSAPAQGVVWISSAQGGMPALRQADGDLYSSLGANFPSGKATIFVLVKSQFSAEMRNEAGTQIVNMKCGQAESGLRVTQDANTAGGQYDISPIPVYLYAATCEFGENSVRLNNALLPENNDLDVNGQPGALSDLIVGMLTFADPDAQLQEFIAYDGIKSAGNITSVSQNIAAAYGITLS